MIRALVLYAAVPDPERYAEHVELCRRVEDATFRHGRVFGPGAEPRYHYYAEFEFADRETFNRVSATDEFKATGVDAKAMGIDFEVYLVDVD